MSKLFIRWDEKSPVRISVFKRPSILQDVFEWKLRICPTVVITHSLHIFHANISVVCTFEIDAILSSTLKKKNWQTLVLLLKSSIQYSILQNINMHFWSPSMGFKSNRIIIELVGSMRSREPTF